MPTSPQQAQVQPLPAAAALTALNLPQLVADRPTVAVLPFAAPTDGDEPYFLDGFAEEMIALLAAALAGQAKTAHSPGNLNNQWGLPLSLARLPADAAYGVFELGMNHAGEITPLSTSSAMRRLSRSAGGRRPPPPGVSKDATSPGCST